MNSLFQQEDGYRNTSKQMRVITILLVIFLLILGFYIGGYFAWSDIYRGRFNGRSMKIRLFDTKWELTFWQPLVKIEQLVRKSDFYGQVRSGASLPPAE